MPIVDCAVFLYPIDASENRVENKIYKNSQQQRFCATFFSFESPRDQHT